MPDSNSTTAAAGRRRKLWTKVASIAFLLLIAVLKPKIEAWLDTRNDKGSTAASVEKNGDSFGPGGGDLGTLDISRGSNSSDNPGDEFDVESFAAAKEASPRGKTSGAAKLRNSTDSKSKSGATGRPGTSAHAANNDSRANPSRNSSSKSTSTKSADPPGKLTLVNKTRQEFRSTAGLMYVRGSEEGHRLKHVLKHAEDNPNKPVHGVFDGNGNRDKILAWIDIAYEKGKKGGKGTRVEKQGGRTVYTVRMDSRIGFVGGQKGKRNNHRPCQYLRLVLQNGSDVVTAYPSDSM